MKTILVTGFDPFGGEMVNPAWESVKELGKIESDLYKVELRQIPTVFEKSIEHLYTAIDETNPDIVLCIGQAGGRGDIAVERVAINVNDARIPDNEGNQPIDTPIRENGPTGYWSTLPIKAIVHELKQQGIPASISQTAGTYVCNHLFYGLMHYLAEKEASVRGGFIHIPYLPEQAARQAGQPSMALETIVKGLRLAIETTISNDRDIVMEGGQIS
ncbi:pyroglutamyl-peptidase I [Brevibacillus formosus]|uniref:Pyrrolidone-carboxylate peptidase n=1 Tax=Brevibacillus formosus TaxID=54913 RepID=A0A837KTA6_9BACL|nr:pyroglutamyl-peptidase I [Brevibacillus formosus]KLI00007.1 pyrrolidone-carboxylate peptidase [Brevibacillus formosus]MED1959410.1 pyroglutamyl-peptidase I [Brevibacillus formosus]PSJ96070.1 pyroglutamyl-peptidase I [Brevibacillus formosus]GED56434.1 pyrrolidone-carboxylate peptidase [Brevibacillus formosus]